MDSIGEYPLTIVEAPMGYGKTTAVKHLLNNWDATVHWLRVYDDSADSFWDSFARLFGELKDGLNRSLVQLGLPDDAVSFGEAIKLLVGIELSRSIPYRAFIRSRHRRYWSCMKPMPQRKTTSNGHILTRKNRSSRAMNLKLPAWPPWG